VGIEDSARSPAETVEHARLTEALHPDVDAVALYRDALVHAPDDPFAHFRLGALLLERGDAAGIEYLQRAMELDADSTESALYHLDRYYRETGDTAGQDRVADEWKRLQAGQAQVQQARGELTTRDEFLPHGLDAAALASVRAALERSGGVGRAWLARKRLPGADGGLPHHVMLVKWRGMVFSEDAKLQKIVDARELPGSCMVFIASNRRGIARKLRKAAVEPVYRKGWW
jgi:tetratricopeptide (TPR) repeat protein